MLVVFVTFLASTTLLVDESVPVRFDFPVMDFEPAGISDNLEDFVDQISNLHDPADIGTHSDFAEMQDKDGTFDTLTEEDTSGAGGSEWLDCNAHDTTQDTLITLVGDTPYLNAQDQPTHYVWSLSNGAQTGWYDFPTTSLSGTLTVNISIYCNSDDTDDKADVMVDYTGSGAGADVGDAGLHTDWLYDTIDLGTHTVAEVNALRVWFDYIFVGAKDEVRIDHVRIGVSAAGGTNYDLDLEVGWLTADFDETNEELCIFAGTQGSEALQVDVWNGAWTNVITDVVAGWNNVSVSSYLTDATFEIRFTDTTGDAVEADTWQVEAVLLHTWTTSYTPVNDQAPTLDNPSDSNNMYAQYLEYQITVYVSDQNGFDDIDYLEIGLWDDTQTTEYWRFRYDEDTDTFTEEYDSGTVVSLNAGGSSATESGNDIDATFYFTIDWSHPDISETDAKCYVIDTQAESDTDWYEVNWDIETRLDYSVAPAVTSDDGGTVDIGDLDETFLLGGTLIYYTSVDDYPSSAQVDVWVSAIEYGTNVGPWSDLTLVSGAFEATCYADDQVGTDTYTIKPVIEAAGSEGISLYYTTDLTDTYTATQIQVQSYSSDNPRINIDTAASDHVTLYYAHDSSYVTTGIVTVNGVSATYSGSNGVWNFGDTKATVQLVTYDTVAISGDTHGLIGVDQNTQTLDQIWDKITVQTTVADDSRLNINDNVEIRVTLWLEYDDTYLGSDDSVTLDDVAMAWDAGNSWFDLSRTKATVGLWKYLVNSTSEATYGITALDLNSQEVDVIWDRLVVDIQADDESVLNNVQVNFTLTVTFEYDSTTCTTYEIAIDRETIYWETFTNANKSLFVDTNSDVSYDYNASNVNQETLYGITVFTTNTEIVTWSAGANNPPVNDTAPILTDPHDTDHLYAWIQYYTLTTNVSDQDGYADIVYVELSLYDNARAGEIWRVRYTVIGQVFSVELGGAYIDLSGSSVDESGNDIDITWKIRIDWNHSDLSNIDTKQYVTDGTDSDTDWYESDWEVETRVDILSLAISESRGKTSRNDLSITGKVIYFESASELPLTTALVDVWANGPISDKVDYDLSSGEFSITGVESSATVNLDVYIMRVVVDGAGVGGTNLLHSGHTVTYISDMLKVTLSTGTPHVAHGVEVTIDVSIVYAYDSSAVSSYFADINRNLISFVTINETNPSFMDVENEDMSHTYTIDGANETLYGITEVSWSNQLTVIWGESESPGGPGNPPSDPNPNNETTGNPGNPNSFEPELNMAILAGVAVSTMFVLFYITRDPRGVKRGE